LRPVYFLLVGERSLVLLEATDPSTTCERCGVVIRRPMWPFCPHGSIRPRPLFPAFDYEGRRVDSIQAADRIERESERRYQSEGTAPVRFRAFHQDSSNYDVNTFGPSPQVPVPRRKNIRGRFSQDARGRHTHPAVRRIRGD
jgi:hypothetical protein